MSKVDVSEFKGPLGELMDQCSPENGGRARFEEFKLWLKKVTINILKLLTTVHVSGAKCFVACGAFGENNPAGIKFYLWDNFKDNFLDKVEKNISEATLAVYTLTKPSLDASIRFELTSECEETTLAYLYELISAQTDGQAGPLLTDGKANIFYIRDVKGVLWTVRASWCSARREWYVHAHSVTYPVGWDAGGQVFSQVSSRSLDS